MPSADSCSPPDPTRKELKAGKQKKVERSQLVWAIKGWEAEQDLKALFAKILDHFKDTPGITFNPNMELKDVAYGVKQILCSCIIFDDVVVLDDISEPIEAMEDEVQSIDLLTMSKV